MAESMSAGTRRLIAETLLRGDPNEIDAMSEQLSATGEADEGRVNQVILSLAGALLEQQPPRTRRILAKFALRHYQMPKPSRAQAKELDTLVDSAVQDWRRVPNAPFTLNRQELVWTAAMYAYLRDARVRQGGSVSEFLEYWCSQVQAGTDPDPVAVPQL